MPWQNDIRRLIGQPVGISFRNGNGTSGILCGVERDIIHVIEYLYQNQFATKNYHMNTVRDIKPFPHCGHRQRPTPKMY